MPRKFIWEMPEIESLLKTLQIKLNWKEDYALNKAIPLVTRWAVKNPEHLSKIPLKACKIIKKKVQRGKPLYVVEWSSVKDFGQLENVYETTEPRHLIEKHFPKLVESFGAKTSKKKIAKRSETSSKVKGQRDISEMLETMNLKASQESSDSDLSVIIETEKTANGSGTTKVKGQRDITEMLRTMNLKASRESSDSDSDLSIIVETICNRKTAPTARTTMKETTKASPIYDVSFDCTAETVFNTQRKALLTSRVNRSPPAVVFELGNTSNANLTPDTSSDTARMDSTTSSKPLLSGRVNSNPLALVLKLGDTPEPSSTPDISFDTAKWDSASPSKPSFSGRFNNSPPALLLEQGDTPTANLTPETSFDTARWDSATPSKPFLSGKVSSSPPALVLELGDTPKPNFYLDLSFDTAAERDCNTPTESLLSRRVSSSPPGITIELGDTPKPNFNLDVSFDTTAEWDCNSSVKTPVNNRVTNKPDFDEFDYSTPLPLNERIKLRLIITFLLNGFILHYVTQDVLGIINVRLMLLFSTVMFVSREAFRRACLTKTSQHNWPQVINLLWLTVPNTLLWASVFGYIWIYQLEVPPSEYSTSYYFAVFIIAVSCVIESFAEPIYLFSQAFLYVRWRLFMDCVFMAIKTFSLAFTVAWFPSYAIESFALGQLAASITFVISYALYFQLQFLEKAQLMKDRELHEDNPLLQLPFDTMMDFLPRKLAAQPVIGFDLAYLTLSFFKQGILKQILTEGERYIMTIFSVLSFAEQGVYDVVNNLGSMAARYIFLPIEESGYFYFAQMLQRHLPLEEQPEEDVKRASVVLRYLLRTMSLLGCTILVFGMSYSHLLLWLYGGPTLASGDVNSKRTDYIEWSEYFMAVAFLSAMRSKDPSSQVGACIVNDENKIVGVGYNGMPAGCDDDKLPWKKNAENKLDTKYMYGNIKSQLKQ
nr:EOG090X04LH [Eulimnadia texana]